MAQFRATISGGRGDASRLGTKASGIRAGVNGWNVGVHVRAFHDEHGDGDTLNLYTTAGSVSPDQRTYLGKVTRTADGMIAFTPAVSGTVYVSA